MERCETCKHWVENDDYLEGECQVLKGGLPMDSTPGITLISGQSSDAGFSPMLTAPDFGCVLHEPKEQ